MTLEIGGAVETYWKSIATPIATPAAKPTPRLTLPIRSIASAQTSPSSYSIATIGNHSLTHSSITGNYIYVTVQVTRDLHPVIFSDWRLPENAYELGMADVTLAQFQGLALRAGRQYDHSCTPQSLSEFHRLIARSMISLSELLKVCTERNAFRVLLN